MSAKRKPRTLNCRGRRLVGLGFEPGTLNLVPGDSVLVRADTFTRDAKQEVKAGTLCRFSHHTTDSWAVVVRKVSRHRVLIDESVEIPVEQLSGPAAPEAQIHD